MHGLIERVLGIKKDGRVGQLSPLVDRLRALELLKAMKRGDAVEEGTVHDYSPTSRGVWLDLFFGTTKLVRVGGRRTLSALRPHRIARIWGQYLLSRWRSRNPSPEPPVRTSRAI